MTDKPTIMQAGKEIYEARICKGIPTDCCDYAVISHATGKEVCRVWQEDDARLIANLLNESRESSVAELQAEVERLNNAIEKICIESNSDWAKARDEPRAQIDVIHNIAVDAFFYKHALAQKEPVE